MTRINCELTGCKYNSSCCTSPAEGKKSYCTKAEIDLIVDPDIYQLDCSMFEEDNEKAIECRECQIDKYGGIKLMKEIKFENSTIEDFKN